MFELHFWSKIRQREQMSANGFNYVDIDRPALKVFKTPPKQRQTPDASSGCFGDFFSVRC